MDHLRAMRLFQRVAELGSYARASADFGISSSVSSTVIKDLEAHLGVQLLRRTTRSVSPTAEGARYLERIRVILSEIDDIEDEIKDAGRRVAGHLRVQTPVGFAHQILAPRLPRFLADHPELRIEVLARNGLPDFVGEALDAAVFIGEVPDRDIIRRSLGRSPFVTCAAPDYLARHGQPAGPQDLYRHSTIGIRSSTTGAALPWRFLRDGRTEQIPFDCRAVFEASEPAVEMAASGGGVLQMIGYLVAPDIAAGRLVPILQDWLYPGADIALLYPRHTRRPRRLRVLEDFIVGCCSALHNDGTGFAAGDTFMSIEQLYGSRFDDNLRGHAGANTLWGHDGNDRLYGRSGNDNLQGMNGNDVLYGQVGVDSLVGGDGNDILIGGPGGDILNVGAGIDRAQYSDATAGVLVDLQNATLNILSHWRTGAPFM